MATPSHPPLPANTSPTSSRCLSKLIWLMYSCCFSSATPHPILQPTGWVYNLPVAAVSITASLLCEGPLATFGAASSTVSACAAAFECLRLHDLQFTLCKYMVATRAGRCISSKLDCMGVSWLLHVVVAAHQTHKRESAQSHGGSHGDYGPAQGQEYHGAAPFQWQKLCEWHHIPRSISYAICCQSLSSLVCLHSLAWLSAGLTIIKLRSGEG